MKILVFIAVSLFLSSCTDDDNVASKDTIEYFTEHIRANMSYKVLDE